MQQISPTAKRLILVGALIVLVLGTFGLWAFAPWKLFTNHTVNEPPPAAGSPAPSGSTSQAPHPGPLVVLASGPFRSYEHPTTGVAKVIQLAPAANVVRLVDFRTSDGPDVRVWLSVKHANSADGANQVGYVDLGALKGNIGNQNYPIPAGTSIDGYHSVIIWCRWFKVAFGAAELSGPNVHILDGSQ